MYVCMYVCIRCSTLMLIFSEFSLASILNDYSSKSNVVSPRRRYLHAFYNQSQKTRMLAGVSDERYIIY